MAVEQDAGSGAGSKIVACPNFCKSVEQEYILTNCNYVVWQSKLHLLYGETLQCILMHCRFISFGNAKSFGFKLSTFSDFLSQLFFKAIYNCNLLISFWIKNFPTVSVFLRHFLYDTLDKACFDWLQRGAVSIGKFSKGSVNEKVREPHLQSAKHSSSRSPKIFWFWVWLCDFINTEDR